MYEMIRQKKFVKKGIAGSITEKRKYGTYVLYC